MPSASATTSAVTPGGPGGACVMPVSLAAPGARGLGYFGAAGAAASARDLGGRRGGTDHDRWHPPPAAYSDRPGAQPAVLHRPAGLRDRGGVTAAGRPV